MKYLGIDYGSKRIGLAISNNEGTIAFPHIVIENSHGTFDKIISIINSENIEGIVIGKSVDSLGYENKIQHSINVFIKKLSEIITIEIFQQDERGSSIAAATHLYGKGNIANARWSGKDNKKKREHNDAHAASIILQRFLDKEINIFF